MLVYCWFRLYHIFTLYIHLYLYFCLNHTECWVKQENERSCWVSLFRQKTNNNNVSHITISSSKTAINTVVIEEQQEKSGSLPQPWLSWIFFQYLSTSYIHTTRIRFQNTCHHCTFVDRFLKSSLNTTPINSRFPQ